MSDRARFLAYILIPLYCSVLKTNCSFKKDALILNKGVNRARPKKHSDWSPQVIKHHGECPVAIGIFRWFGVEKTASLGGCLRDVV